MNDRLTEISYILDRSGSMQGMAEPAIAGFNRFLAKQCQMPGDARFSLVLFDDEYQLACDRRPLAQVPELTAETYVPRGMTALLDAIGRTIDELGAKLAAEPEADRPGTVIVAIFTDGYENASRHYNLAQISRMIRHQRDHYQWEFLFLAAGQDAIATAATMGIEVSDASDVSFSIKGMASYSAGLSRKISALRQKQALGQDVPDLGKTMQEIVREEELD